MTSSIYESEEGKQKIEGLYRQALQRWPVPNRQLLVPTRQGDTFVIASGEQNETPVVLLHGSGTNSAVWMRDVADLAERYRVYAIDIVGEPGLSAPSRPPLKSVAYAEWLDEVWGNISVSPAPASACRLAAGSRSTTPSVVPSVWRRSRSYRRRASAPGVNSSC